MRTINKNLKVTNSELESLTELFEKGITLVRKVKLFGAGHPQLPSIFLVSGDDEQVNEFWEDHETTHARFEKYNSISEMKRDEHLWRGDFCEEGAGMEINFEIDYPHYDL